MEKRALLAFLLSMGVLIAWQVLFSPKEPPQEPVKQQQQIEAPAGQTAVPATTAPAEGGQQAAESGGGPADVKHTPLEAVAPDQFMQPAQKPLSERFKTWTVDSPLFEAKVIEVGGRMLSVELKKYHTSAGTHAELLELIPSSTGGYLPLAVDLLRHPDWGLSTRNYQCNVEDKLDVAAGSGTKQLTLSTEVPGKVRFTKELSFSPDSYLIDAKLKLENISDAPVGDQVGISFYFMPVEDGTKTSSYNPSRFGYLKNGTIEYMAAKDIEKDKEQKKEKRKIPIGPPVDWAGYGNNYFLHAMVPPEESGYQIIPRVVDETTGLIQVVYLSAPFVIEPGQSKEYTLPVYLGPKKAETLQRADHQLERAADYGFWGFLAKPLLRVLIWLYNYTHNYGVAIIIMTVVIKIIFWPLTHKSMKSMQGMKQLQPKITELREKYKDDREKLNAELMQLYRTYKVNPLGGCLPMVLQIPVFLALYRMLYGAVELYQQPFCLWIHDLTAPDRLDIGVALPYLGQGLPVLTLLMGASMFLQQKMMPTGGDPRQEKIMLMMPIVFTVLFVNFPSGLVLYWFTNNILQIAQQFMIERSKKK